MNNIALFFVVRAISLGLTKKNKPVLPARILATSLDPLDTAYPSNSLNDEKTTKETWFRPCDCGGQVGRKQPSTTSPNKNVHPTSLVYLMKNVMDIATILHTTCGKTSLL